MPQSAVLALALVLSIVLPHWIVRRDDARLEPEQSRRGWGGASHWSAIVAFNWIAVPVHFVRTRRSFAGFALGVGWTVLGLASQAAILFVVEWIAGLF